ncbi:hypothetical protein HDV57DRAFT_298514 [Trichoderma longibrachiatum]|uniref:Uncharacterized protein n=1 Tax=Trichoderma longibrachiatum ATCC 18648 TaxID=983965 RepID=A0A2T4CCK5_TRILO|nr:hypothetical protein M440DRAFT_1165936 [Trichoderma longibrachiatum ATCC 18648]
MAESRSSADAVGKAEIMNRLLLTGDAGFGPGAQIGLGSAGGRGFAATRERIEVGLDDLANLRLGDPDGGGQFQVGARGYDCKVQRRERGERRWRSHCCPQITTWPDLRNICQACVHANDGDGRPKLVHEEPKIRPIGW